MGINPEEFKTATFTNIREVTQYFVSIYTITNYVLFQSTVDDTNLSVYIKTNEIVK
jgi:hypothetical protein